MMVVTTIVLPLETERKVDGVSERVGVVLDGEVVEGVGEGVEEGVWVEVDEDDDCTEVDDDEDVELLPEVVV